MNKKENEGMENYQNLNTEDIPDETWIDIMEFDGIYQVSNYGRIKSLPREVVMWHGGIKITDERILKQSRLKKKGKPQECVVTLRYLDTKKTYHVNRIVYESFYPNDNFGKYDCVMHKNKIVTDNRLCNLKKVTRTVSKRTDMKLSIPTILATPKNLEKANEFNRLKFEGRTTKMCSKCGKESILDDFPNDRSTCKNCINKYVRVNRDKLNDQPKIRMCSRCGELKEQKMFWKNRSWCNKCMAGYAKEWRQKSKKV